jgi:hypothetical protein
MRRGHVTEGFQNYSNRQQLLEDAAPLRKVHALAVIVLVPLAQRVKKLPLALRVKGELLSA